MNKNYETPTIEIVSYDLNILTAGGSIVIDFPWSDEYESDYFK